MGKPKCAEVKAYRKLDKPTRKRIKDALIRLRERDYPLLNHGVRPLTGQLRGDYRLRVGRWRALFTPDAANRVIYVYAILPRGNAYKD